MEEVNFEVNFILKVFNFILVNNGLQSFKSLLKSIPKLRITYSKSFIKSKKNALRSMHPFL